MTTTCVLGVGSPFGDDRLGWIAAGRLCETVCDPEVRIEVLDRPGAALIDAWRGADRVIIIDAIRSNAAPGSLHRFHVDDIMAMPAATSSHSFGIAASTALAGALNALPASMTLYGIEAERQWEGDELSPVVRAALPELLNQLLIGLGSPVRRSPP